MSSFTFSSPDSCYAQAATWDSLKSAIATSSGFERWCQEQNDKEEIQNLSQDERVLEYLRETLETLAY